MGKVNFVQKKYLKLMIAGLLGWIVSVIGDMGDSFLAGLFISEEAVGSVELVSPIFSILFAICTMIGIGSATLFSRAAGAFDKEKANRICGMGLLLSVIISVIAGAAMFFGKDAYFTFYGSGGEVDELAREYYDCFIVLAFIYPTFWEFYYLVMEDGDEKNILASDIIMAAGNLVLSLLFIPNWGIRGLGWGTVLSTVIAAVPFVIHFSRKNNSIHFRPYFSRKALGSIIAISSASALGMFYVGIMDIMMNKFIIERFGEIYLGSYAVVNLVLNMADCLICGAEAASPFISTAYGEHNPKSLLKLIRMVTRYTFALSVVFTVAGLVISPYLPGFFGIEDPAVMEAAVYSGRVLAFSYLASGFLVEMNNFYSKIGEVLQGNIAGMIHQLAAPLGLSVLLANLWGYKGMVWGFLLAPVVALLFNFLYTSVKYGVRRFPYIIKEDPKNRIFLHDLYSLTPEEIVAVRDAVSAELAGSGVSSEITNLVSLMIEETFLLVRERNGKKKVLADCTIIVSDKLVQLITRDDGVIFDITDANEKIRSLRSYVAARLMETDSDTTYMTTTSFNRNSYVWER